MPSKAAQVQEALPEPIATLGLAVLLIGPDATAAPSGLGRSKLKHVAKLRGREREALATATEEETLTGAGRWSVGGQGRSSNLSFVMRVALRSLPTLVTNPCSFFVWIRMNESADRA